MVVKTVRHQAKASLRFRAKRKEPARWRQQVWIVNRKNWTPSHHVKLCQGHFERSYFVSDPTVLDSVGFKPGRLRLKKTSAVDRIVLIIFHCVELRTDLSLLGTGSTPLKPSLAITKRTNLKLLEESAADYTVPTSVEKVVTPDDACQDSRVDSFQSVSVQTLPISSIPRGTQTGWYSVSRGVQVLPSGLKIVATQTEILPIIYLAYGTESSPAAKKSSVSQVTDADVHMSDDEGADPD